MTTIREVQAFLQQRPRLKRLRTGTTPVCSPVIPDTAVSGILLTLDITPQAVDFAAGNGCIDYQPSSVIFTRCAV